MNTEILGVILQWVALVVLCYPLGRYIAKVYRGERTWLDFMAPLERGIYKVCGIREDEEMDWKQFLKALLMVNLFWFFWGMLLLVFQVSGAGGAYPLELLPGWFQSMSPFLPATYAIRAFRASIAGIYQGDYWLDILGLLVFILPALLLGLVLRKGLDGYNRRMDEGIAESKVLA